MGIRTVEPLIVTLKDKAPNVRGTAIDALGELKDNRAVKPLIKILINDKDPSVRANAAKALGKIGDKTAISYLIKMLDDKNSEVRENAAEALNKITGEDFGEDAQKWKKWCQKNKNQ